MVIQNVLQLAFNCKDLESVGCYSWIQNPPLSKNKTKPSKTKQNQLHVHLPFRGHLSLICGNHTEAIWQQVICSQSWLMEIVGFDRIAVVPKLLSVQVWIDDFDILTSQAHVTQRSRLLDHPCHGLFSVMKISACLFLFKIHFFPILTVRVIFWPPVKHEKI